MEEREARVKEERETEKESLAVEKCGTRGAINLAAVVRLARWAPLSFLFPSSADLSLHPNSSANVGTTHGAV